MAESDKNKLLEKIFRQKYKNEAEAKHKKKVRK